MEVINHALAIIKPKPPYLAWANGLPNTPDDVTLDDLRRNSTRAGYLSHRR